MTVTTLKNFLSLKWKVILSLSVVLLVVNGAFTGLHYRSLSVQHEKDQLGALERRARLANQLFDQSSARLRQLANLIPDIAGARQSMAAGNVQELTRNFDPHWVSLQLESGLDQVRFYDSSGKLLAGWGEQIGRDPALLTSLVREANNREAPQHLLSCRLECVNYALVPVLTGGRSVGVVLVASSLADVILTFTSTTGVDIGVIAPVNDPLGARSERISEAMQGRVVALSNYLRNREVLARVGGDWKTVREGVQMTRVQFNHRTYEVVKVPVRTTNQIGDPYFVMVSDVTAALSQIDQATLGSVIAGGVGLLLSEALVLIVLWSPMARLRRTATTIPRLGVGDFEGVRKQIRKHFAHAWRKDEIVLLDETALALADTLETLQREAHAHAGQQANLVEALSRERDFVTQLLDTAHVAIVTQDATGRVIMANSYSRELTGYTVSELVGADFISRFAVAAAAEENRRALAQLLAGTETHVRQEMALERKDGGLRSIVWMHSRLSGAHAVGESVILSVGLDATELRQAEQQVSYLAEYDALTSLFNRRRFQEELRVLIGVNSASATPGAVLCLDIDEFKSVNDTGGHAAGDALLRAVARELQQLDPRPMLVGRLGGDDFGIVFTDMNEQGAIRMAQQINQILGRVELPEMWRIHRVSACIGIVVFPGHGDTPQELLAHADLAMFHAKEKGKGSWHLYSPDEQLMERVLKRMYWVEKIEQALAEDRFDLHFQPIMSVSDDRVSHYEALLRMRKVDGSLAGPGDFIGVAEATGLIRAIDHVVLRKAVRKLAELERNGSPIKLSVNISGRSFEDPKLLDTLKEELARQSVRPENLIFEITETAAVADFDAARTLMESVRQLGCAFSLDDFGVGFSSFHYLKQLPVDYVKIDGSFIRNLEHSQDDQVFVRVLVEAARGFGKKTVAEFVESARILELLRGYGVDYVQGYHIGKPVPHISKAA